MQKFYKYYPNYKLTYSIKNILEEIINGGVNNEKLLSNIDFYFFLYYILNSESASAS